MKNLTVAIAILTYVNVMSQLTPTFDEITIPMRDNELLSADVYIPAGVDSCQIILIQTPYNKNQFEQNLPLGIGQNLDGQPYGFVIVDWRGFYGSSGADLSNFTRGEDGYDIIQWITEQPWHLDRVGTWGPSALGGVQYSTAREQHPNHTCAVPLVAQPQSNYQDYFYGGVLEESRLQTLDALGYGLSPIIMANTYYSIYWQFAENSTWYPSDIIIPTLQIGGWYDHNIDLMMKWYEATRNQSAAQDQQWLLVGPWVHGGTGLAYVGSSNQGELNYPNAALMNNTMALEFFNYYLLDSANNWQNTDKITYYELGEDVWNYSNASTIDQPLSDVLYLGDNNLLRTTNGIGTTTFTSDPSNPSPTLGGPTLALGLDQGPFDQVSLDSRNDVVTFQSGVLYADATITGQVIADLFISADQPDCDIMIRMVDVYPDGRSMLINDGARRMRFRNGYYQSDEAFMSSGQVYPVQVTMPFTNYTWKAGHRIKIYVSANSATRWNVNLQDGGTMYQSGSGNAAQITLHHNATYPSKITLPGSNTSLATPTLPETSLSIYPNPTGDVIYIEGTTDANYRIIDMAGKQVLSGRGNSVDLGAMQSGLYLLEVQLETGNKQFQIIKE